MTIHERILAKCEELGSQAAADFFGESVLTIRAWQRNDGKKKPGLKHADLLLEAEAAIQIDTSAQDALDRSETEGDELRTCKEFVNTITDQITALKPKLRIAEDASASDILQAVLDGKWSRKVVLLTPFNRDINPNVHFNIVALIRKNPWLGYDYVNRTIIQKARNMLAHRFLASEAEWSLWMDSDNILPFGEPGFIGIRMKGADRVPPQRAALNAVERLISHGKTIVGGPYKRRGEGDGWCIQPHINPMKESDRSVIERLDKGYFDELLPVGWVATGCALIHRSVYMDIMSKFPQHAAPKEGEEYDFFGHKANVSGEDMFFGKMAAEAGHQSWLDAGLPIGHLGSHCWW